MLRPAPRCCSGARVVAQSRISRPVACSPGLRRWTACIPSFLFIDLRNNGDRVVFRLLAREGGPGQQPPGARPCVFSQWRVVVNGVSHDRVIDAALGVDPLIAELPAIAVEKEASRLDPRGPANRHKVPGAKKV